MNESGINLSTDMAVSMAKNFLRDMAQPMDEGLGSSIWNEAEVHRRQKLELQSDDMQID